MSERQQPRVRKVLGARLRATRKVRELSQESLGDRAGLSGKFIGEVERSEKSISIDSLYRVAAALHVPLRELTDIDSDQATPEIEAIAATARKLPVKMRARALQMLRALA